MTGMRITARTLTKNVANPARVIYEWNNNNNSKQQRWLHNKIEYAF